MKRILIGHRGVGKTSLLQRHQIYFPDFPHIDLDAEIDRVVRMPRMQYFNQVDETQFRKTEKEVYQQIKSLNDEYVISIGAGFNVAELDPTDEIIFVSRLTDAYGRIFLNRPRLNPDLSPLLESKQRYHERNQNFIHASAQIYFMPEGLDSADATEKNILAGNYKITDAYYTLAAQEIPHIESLMRNFTLIELRTDLLDTKDIEKLTKTYPFQQWLVSYRNQNQIELNESVLVDWDVELGILPKKIDVLSSHQNNTAEGIKRLGNSSAHLKLCPLVESWEDLRAGYEWQQADPVNRSFLPRSTNGKWIWYRQLSKYLQKINFIRNYTCMNDQASVYEWLVLPETKPNEWAAVLGSPVYFSRTPVQHENYFALKNAFVTKIDLSPEEFKKNIKWLISLDLVYAAVTSPLKETAYQLSANVSTIAEELKSVNTLWVNEKQIVGHNTDFDGFRFLTEKIQDQSEVAVWGGGGTLHMMKKVSPKAHYYSSQTGAEREGQPFKSKQIKTLIWAAPRTSSTVFPSEAFNIQEVIDLNYTENSMGLEYAAQKNIKYTSGLAMFQEQARKQQEYWSTK